MASGGFILQGLKIIIFLHFLILYIHGGFDQETPNVPTE